MHTSWSDEFERLTPHIEAALAHAGNTHTPADVWAAIERRDAQFWPLHDSVIVTEIVSYPAGRSVRFWLAGGNLDELLEAEPLVTRWAKENYGCTRAEVIGRKGWVRKLTDYRPAAVLLTKEIAR